MTEDEVMKSFMRDTAALDVFDAAGREESPPPLENPVPDGARVIDLPEPGLLPEPHVNFLEMAEVRASVRQYSGAPITAVELSFLLWCTQGVKMVSPEGAVFRTVPSAGARHAFETYLVVNRVEGLSPGVYRFLALGHALTRVEGSAVREAVTEAFRAKEMVRESAVTFIWCADFRRMSYRFGSRAARYVFLDAGHVCQNLYLAAYAEGLGACAIGAFYDDAMNKALGLGEEDFAVYAATVGRPL